jgi:BirA family biotin operon repressor/biotin-[acetyl-CoA-carboxylase] ligase
VSGSSPPPAAQTPSTLGHPRVHLQRTDSTSERARELALAGAPHGTLVTAAQQTAGRGRQGRRWSAPAGSSVLMSLLLRDPPELLPLAAAIAVCDVAGEHALIKWPNDVVIDTSSAGASTSLAKLAGILIEGRPQEGWMVLGIGLNVAVHLDELPAELQAVHLDELPAELQAGSPERVASRAGMPAATLGLSSADVEPLLARLIGALEHRLGEPPEVTLRAWRARDALYGREITWGTHTAAEQPGRGRAEGIDGTGRLIVTLADGGRTTIGAGEVHLREIA